MVIQGAHCDMNCSPIQARELVRSLSMGPRKRYLQRWKYEVSVWSLSAYSCWLTKHAIEGSVVPDMRVYKVADLSWKGSMELQRERSAQLPGYRQTDSAILRIQGRLSSLQARELVFQVLHLGLNGAFLREQTS
jgi:hypothetical protein